MMRLSRDRASSAFVLAESIDSEESFPPASSPSYESSSYSSVSDIFSSSSISSSSSPSPSPSLSPSSQAVDENNLSSSTISNLWSSIFGPTSSTSISFSPSSMGSTTISSLLSSYSSSPLSTLPSSVETTTTTTTTTVTTSHHHHHHHSLTPFTPTLPTRIIDFGDKFLREEQRCVALVPETYDPVISTLCGLAVLIGLIYILAGYRLFRSVLFLTGFLIASSLVYGFIVLTSSPIPFYGTLIVSLSAGLLTGLVTFLVAWLGLFCLGFDLGSLIGTIIILSIHLLSPHVDTLSPPQSIWITFSVIAGWGIIGAFSTLYFQKGCTILATCMFGSAFVIAGLDYFVENFNLFNWFWANLKTNGNEYLMATITRTASTSTGPDEPALFMCLISWILVMLWFILVSVGLFCQWCATGRGYYHSGNLTSSTSSRRNGTLDLVKIRAEESKTEQKQRKYRYLYQVRTAHGDVISQHYIQNFQKKLSPQMDHNDSLRTYNSDLSHLTSYNQSESRTTTMSHLP